MENFRHTQIPAFKLLVILITFTLLVYHYELSNQILFYSAFGFSLLSIIMLILKRQVLCYFFMALAISAILNLRLQTQSSSFPDEFIAPIPGIIDGKITRVVTKKDNYVSFIADISFDSKFSKNLPAAMFIQMFSTDENKISKLIPGARIQAEVTASIPDQKQIVNEFDQRAYAHSNGIDFMAKVEKSKLSILNYDSKFQAFISSARQIIQDRIEVMFSESTSGVVTAILTGDKSKLSPLIRDTFSKSGTAHLLAVSGLHVGIIAVILFVCLGSIKSRTMKLILFVLCIWLFILFTGATPPGIRAGIFASLFALLKYSQNRVNPLNVLGMTGIIVLLIEPLSLFSASFQMSFASVFGIIVFYQFFRRSFIILFKSKSEFTPLINSLAITIAAGVVVSPLVAYYFGIHSLISPIANLVAVPLMTLALAHSLIGILLSFLMFDFGNIFCMSAEFLINSINQLNEILASLDFSYVSSENVVLISFLMSLLITYTLISRNLRLLVTRFAVSLVVFGLALQLLPEPSKENQKIVLRKDFVAYIDDDSNQRYIYILDRKPSIFPTNDYYLNQYLADFEGQIYLGYTGNCGINIADFIKEEKSIFEFLINHEIEQKLNIICNKGNEFVKRVKYDR